jgi:phosphopantetheinyl transferase
MNLNPQLPAPEFSRYPNDARRITQGKHEYRFSLSHAGKRGVLMVAPVGCCIGIDLHHNTGRNYDKLIERVVRKSEAVFLRFGICGFDILWALKEAALKAWGIGMRVAPWDVEVQLDKHQIMIHNLEQTSLPPLYGGVFSVAKDYTVGYAWLFDGYEQIKENFFVPRPLHLEVGSANK